MTTDVDDTQVERNGTSIVLEYAAQSPPTDCRQRAGWLVLSLPALLAPFAGFVHDVSPLDAVRSGFGELLALGAGFFVGLIVFGWRAVLVARMPPRRMLVRIGIGLAVVAWCPCGFIFVPFGFSVFQSSSSVSWSELLAGGLPIEVMGAVFIMGVLVIARQLSRADRHGALTTALTTPYLICTIFCLLSFHSAQNWGYWLTLYIVILWGAELIWEGIHPIANRFRRARRL